MTNFLKYYFRRLSKRWWLIVVLIPKLLPQALELYTFYFPEDTETPVNVTNLIDKYAQDFPWILLLTFILANILITFDLWKKLEQMKEESVSTGLNDDYEAIADWVRVISPTKYDGFMKKLKIAYKHYTKQNSVNNIICTHFSVYRLIDEIIKDCYKEKTIQRSTNTTQLTDAFIDNYKEFNRLNDEIGKNNPIDTDIFSANKMIRNTNDNLRSIFPYYS